jgi:DNA-binding NarL/FixJ family response regulator
MIKFLIADDHAVVRKGIKQILADEFLHATFGEAQNAHEVLEQAQKQTYDIVILDITLPGKSGLDVLKELKLAQPKLPVFVVSMHSEEQYAVRVLKAGASGYMTKESAPKELINAVRKILSGGKYVSPLLAEKLAFDLETKTEKPLHEMLSDREYQVMFMIASGKTVTTIADELHLSVKTISTYRERILEKMKMKSNAELTHYAIKNKLVE